MATPRSNAACTAGSQEVAKLTLPSFSSCWAKTLQVSAPEMLATKNRCLSFIANSRGKSAIELHHCLTEPDAAEGIRNRAVDGKDRKLELITRLDLRAQDHAVGHVEALNCCRARITATPRHLPVHVDLRIVVNQHVEHGDRRLAQ